MLFDFGTEVDYTAHLHESLIKEVSYLKSREIKMSLPNISGRDCLLSQNILVPLVLLEREHQAVLSKVRGFPASDCIIWPFLLCREVGPRGAR